MDIDPLYVDVAVRRWQAFTGKDAILEANYGVYANGVAPVSVTIAATGAVRNASDLAVQAAVRASTLARRLRPPSSPAC